MTICGGSHQLSESHRALGRFGRQRTGGITMISQLPKHMGNFYYGAVVEPSPELGSVQVPDGTLMPAGELGPGVVKEIAGDDRIKVRWEGPDVEVWMEPGELSSLGPNAHLITIFRCDEHGQ